MTATLAYLLVGGAVAMPSLLQASARAGVPGIVVKPTPGQQAALASFASSLQATDIVDVDSQVTGVFLNVKRRLGLFKNDGGDVDTAIAAFKAEDAETLLAAWIAAATAGAAVSSGGYSVGGSFETIALGNASPDDFNPLGQALIAVVAERDAIEGGIFSKPLPYDPARVLRNLLQLSIAMDDQGADTTGGVHDPSVFDALVETGGALLGFNAGPKAVSLGIDEGKKFLKDKLHDLLPDTSDIVLVLGAVVVIGIVAWKVLPTLKEHAGA